MTVEREVLSSEAFKALLADIWFAVGEKGIEVDGINITTFQARAYLTIQTDFLVITQKPNEIRVELKYSPDRSKWWAYWQDSRATWTFEGAENKLIEVSQHDGKIIKLVKKELRKVARNLDRAKAARTDRKREERERKREALRVQREGLIDPFLQGMKDLDDD